MASDSLADLLRLFTLERKSELVSHCRKLTVRSEDLANLLLTGRVQGVGSLLYANHHQDLTPPELEPSPEELRELALQGVGRLQGGALKAARELDQSFRDRRLLSVHLFYTRSGRYWHLFYFDQRDFRATGNHWKLGPHIHYSQDLLVREPLKEVWEGILATPPKLPKAIHIRYDYHHNRTGA